MNCSLHTYIDCDLDYFLDEYNYSDQEHMETY